MNNQRYSVRASNIEVIAPIGLYPEEKLIDNQFLVNVEVESDRPYAREHFVDYEKIVEAVKEEFSLPHEILEEVARGIISRLVHKFGGNIASIHCDIQKMNPAVTGMKIGSLGVSITELFENR